MADPMAGIHAVMNFILPFRWAEPAFMKNTLLALLMIAPITSMLGSHITAFRMAFYSDAISHSAFTGVALGFLFSVNPLLSMLFFAVAVGLTVIQVERRSRIAMDSVISAIMSLAVALGLAVISLRQEYMRDFQQYLFGYILSVNAVELLLLLGVFALVSVFSFFFFNRLTLLSVQRDLAQNRFRNAETARVVFSVIVAIVVTVSIKVIGMLLITSLLVLPPITARLLARNTSGAFWTSLALSIAASAAGLVLSYYVNISTGPAIIIILAAAFFISLPVKALLRQR